MTHKELIILYLAVRDTLNWLLYDRRIGILSDIADAVGHTIRAGDTAENLMPTILRKMFSNYIAEGDIIDDHTLLDSPGCMPATLVYHMVVFLHQQQK